MKVVIQRVSDARVKVNDKIIYNIGAGALYVSLSANIGIDVAEKIIEENNNFTPPTECIFNLSGKSVKEKMIKILEKLYNEKVILDHGVTVAKELAHVLSGGDTTIDKTLNEDDLYKLELDAFMRLIETQKTQDRIKHTLATGKPLVN